MTTPRYIWDPEEAKIEAAQWPDGVPMDLQDAEQDQEQAQDAEEYEEFQQEQAATCHRFH